VVVLDSVITHTNTWFLDGEIHQLVFQVKLVTFINNSCRSNYIMKSSLQIATTMYNNKILTSTILETFCNYFQALTFLILHLCYVNNDNGYIYPVSYIPEYN